VTEHEHDPAKTQVLAVLAAHVGRGRGIGAHPLAETVGVTERRLRACISQLREEGVAVCGHPKSGYFIAATAEELEESCQFLRSRALHSLAIEARLRKIPLPDLIGQLHLPT
jgi:biotin operon repressor